jgi:hypothetical protein
METKHNIRLTSAEVANLWNSYMAESMAICILQYFINKAEDTEVKSQLEFALTLSQNHKKELISIFNSEDFPIPKSFSDEDVNFNAPRLYADVFLLLYVRNMAKFGLAANGLGLSLATRKDICEFYSQCLNHSNELQVKVTQVMLEKGIYVRAPYISKPEAIDFVEEQGFMQGWFGERRPLLAMEIAHLYLNMTNNIMGKTLLMGFARVAKSKEVREYLDRGVKIASKHVEIFHSIMNENNLPSPSTHDTDVMDSQVAPFSDKLMMFQGMQIGAAGIANYGGAIGLTLRRDLVTHYTRMMAESGIYLEDGSNLMIKNRWMEQPPQADNHRELVKQL